MSERTRQDLEAMLEEVRPVRAGEPAAYLAGVGGQDVDAVAAATCTVHGDLDVAGDSGEPFALQSISKAFVYAMAVQERGVEAVLERVGVEPSGEAFDELSLRAGGRPFNPLVNAGAIMVHAMLPGGDEDARLAFLRERLSALAGRELSVDRAVFEAELAHADRNLSIGHLLASHHILSDSVADVVRGYSLQCSINVTVADLAVMGATMAGGGLQPVTGEQVLSEEAVRHALSVMMTCGMYDSSGRWVMDVGVPAKSGVSGGLMACVPGVMGLASYSPRLDVHGGSVRGLLLCERLSEQWDLHLLRHREAQQVRDRGTT